MLAPTDGLCRNDEGENCQRWGEQARRHAETPPPPKSPFAFEKSYETKNTIH